MTEETGQKPTLKVLPKDLRPRLFGVLIGIIGFAEEKRKVKGNSDRSKLAWSRICISAISAAGDLLRDVDLDDLEARLTVLENRDLRY